MLQFGGQKLDSVGKAGGGENFVVNALEDFLGDQFTGKAFTEYAKEVRLFDVFFAVEQSSDGHTSMITLPPSFVMRPVVTQDSLLLRKPCVAGRCRGPSEAKRRRFGE